MEEEGIRVEEVKYIEDEREREPEEGKYSTGGKERSRVRPWRGGGR